MTAKSDGDRNQSASLFSTVPFGARTQTSRQPTLRGASGSSMPDRWAVEERELVELQEGHNMV